MNHSEEVSLWHGQGPGGGGIKEKIQKARPIVAVAQTPLEGGKVALCVRYPLGVREERPGAQNYARMSLRHEDQRG